MLAVFSISLHSGIYGLRVWPTWYDCLLPSASYCDYLSYVESSVLLMYLGLTQYNMTWLTLHSQLENSDSMLTQLQLRLTFEFKFVAHDLCSVTSCDWSLLSGDCDIMLPIFHTVRVWFSIQMLRRQVYSSIIRGLNLNSKPPTLTLLFGWIHANFYNKNSHFLIA